MVGRSRDPAAEAKREALAAELDLRQLHRREESGALAVGRRIRYLRRPMAWWSRTGGLAPEPKKSVPKGIWTKCEKCAISPAWLGRL